MASRAALALVRAARANEAAAQLELGRLYLAGGEGLSRNLAAATHWLLRAAENGSDLAAALLAERLPPDAFDDPPRAQRWIEAAAAAGSARAALTLASWLMTGKLGLREPERTRVLLAQAAAAGLPEAQRLLAQLMLEEAGREAPQDARALLQSAAEHGDESAQAALAELLWESEYLDCWQAGEIPGEAPAFMPPPEACAEALHWHEELARTSRMVDGAEFRYRLGVLLLRARRRDALPHLEHAAEAGHARAHYLLGLLHMGPRFVGCLAVAEDGAPRGAWLPRNYKKATRWLERAAGAELAEASFALHLLHGLRGFSHRDAAAERRHLHDAAMRGHPEAQFRLGRLLVRGGREGEDLEAARWLSWAVAQGHREADALRQKLVHRAPEASAEERAKRRAAMDRIAPNHPGLAARLLLADAFGLRRHELLLIEPATAAAGDILVADVRRSKLRTRRLIAIETAVQRAALDQARARIPPGDPLPGDVHGPYRRRWEQFRSLCERLDIDWSLFG